MNAMWKINTFIPLWRCVAYPVGVQLFLLMLYLSYWMNIEFQNQPTWLTFFFKYGFSHKIKTEVKTIGPLLDMLRISLRGIKHFQGQKN